MLPRAPPGFCWGSGAWRKCRRMSWGAKKNLPPPPNKVLARRSPTTRRRHTYFYTKYELRGVPGLPPHVFSGGRVHSGSVDECPGVQKKLPRPPEKSARTALTRLQSRCASAVSTLNVEPPGGLMASTSTRGLTRVLGGRLWLGERRGAHATGWIRPYFYTKYSGEP